MQLRCTLQEWLIHGKHFHRYLQSVLLIDQSATLSNQIDCWEFLDIPESIRQHLPMSAGQPNYRHAEINISEACLAQARAASAAERQQVLHDGEDMLGDFSFENEHAFVQGFFTAAQLRAVADELEQAA